MNTEKCKNIEEAQTSAEPTIEQLKESVEQYKRWLHNCHEKIDELEREKNALATVVARLQISLNWKEREGR